MNPIQLAMHARGLGALGADGPWVNPDIFTRDFGPPPSLSSGSGGNWYQDWGGGLINQAGQILTGIFGNRGGNNLTLQQQQQALLLAQQQAALAAANNPNGAPGSKVAGGLAEMWQSAADAFGISSGTLTMLTVGGVALLLMKPPSRGR